MSQFIARLKSDQCLIVEIEGHGRQVSKVLEEFVTDINQYSQFDLEPHKNMRIELISTLTRREYQIPVGLIRFSNLWDAPISILFSNIVV